MRVMGRLAGTLAILVVSGAVALEPTPWERYLSQPTPENAKRVTRIAYSGDQLDPGQTEIDLQLLAVQVVSSDTQAVRLAFRLRSQADGHLGETIDIVLGRLIRVNPNLFLTALRDQAHPIVRLDSLVGNFGPEYIDNDTAQRYEAERRRAALLTVANHNLVTTRDECLAELKRIER